MQGTNIKECISVQVIIFVCDYYSNESALSAKANSDPEDWRTSSVFTESTTIIKENSFYVLSLAYTTEWCGRCFDFPFSDLMHLS